MNYFSFAWMTFRNRLLEEYRYPLQAVVNLLVFSGFVFLIASGSSVLIGGDIAVNFTRVFLAFFLGVGLTSIMQTLMDKGSLEEFYLYPLKSAPMLLAAGVGRLLESVLTMAFLVYLVPGLLLGQPDLSWRFLTATPLVAFFALGLGMVIAGLSLVYRKLGQLPQILMLLLLALAVGVPDSLLAFMKGWFPLAAAVLHTRGGEAIVWSAWVVSISVLALGIAIFAVLEKQMFARGLIGQE